MSEPGSASLAGGVIQGVREKKRWPRGAWRAGPGGKGKDGRPPAGKCADA